MGDEGLTNGDFFVLNPRCRDQIDGYDTRWEDESLTRLAAEDQLKAYKHHGSRQPIDTVRKQNLLEDRWASGGAPWKT